MNRPLLKRNAVQSAQTPAIEFLKKLKLKSRACFMNILEFIPTTFDDYSMPVLKDLLVCLSPNGGQFYDRFIYDGEPKGIQFVFVVDKFSEYCTTLYIQNIIQ